MSMELVAGIISTENLVLIVSALLVLAGMLISDRLIRRAISRYSKKSDLDPHAANVLKLVFRIIVFSAGIIAFMTIFNIGTDWFIGVSALTGAAIGFASTQTVGNFLAGFYLMISRPFMVRDYVKIGDVEGEVREITINYTMIYTPSYNMTVIPNRKVLDSIILNYSGKKNIIDYSFAVGFPHHKNVTNNELIKECITSSIETFYDKHKDLLPKKPEASMLKMDRLGREVMIRMFFPEGKTKQFYDIQPELLQEIINNWDKYMEKKN